MRKLKNDKHKDKHKEQIKELKDALSTKQRNLESIRDERDLALDKLRYIKRYIEHIY